ncbi:MAG: cytoplasmic protein [Anaerolinea sp.]|nr:cytoplasmic protein [Anaerolinea sp.]
MDSISADEARNLALAAQGFGRARPSAVTGENLLATLRTMAVVQLDSVNVVLRSHYLPFFARLGAYDRAALDSILNDRSLAFEQWGHQASVMPLEHFPLLRHRWEQHVHWNRALEHLDAEHPGLVDNVLDQVRGRGSLTISEIEGRGERQGPWWGYGPGKIALEAHFRRGALAVSRAANFSRVYQLAARVFDPALLSRPVMEAPEAHREMLRIAARAHGIGTARDLADYFRLKLTEARPRLAELVDDGTLETVAVEGWTEPAYVPSGPSAPPPVHARALLSPFDPVVWDRARTERLFGFRYRIEVYTPQAKRVHGYYVMPFLLGNQLVGRVDLKANRQARVLEVFGSYAEEGHVPESFAPDLAAELKHLSTWLGLDSVRVRDRGDLAPALARGDPVISAKRASGGAGYTAAGFFCSIIASSSSLSRSRTVS